MEEPDDCSSDDSNLAALLQDVENDGEADSSDDDVADGSRPVSRDAESRDSHVGSEPERNETPVSGFADYTRAETPAGDVESDGGAETPENESEDETRAESRVSEAVSAHGSESPMGEVEEETGATESRAESSASDDGSERRSETIGNDLEDETRDSVTRAESRSSDHGSSQRAVTPGSDLGEGAWAGFPADGVESGERPATVASDAVSEMGAASGDSDDASEVRGASPTGEFADEAEGEPVGCDFEDESRTGLPESEAGSEARVPGSPANQAGSVHGDVHSPEEGRGESVASGELDAEMRPESPASDIESEKREETPVSNCGSVARSESRNSEAVRTETPASHAALDSPVSDGSEGRAESPASNADSGRRTETPTRSDASEVRGTSAASNFASESRVESRNSNDGSERRVESAASRNLQGARTDSPTSEVAQEANEEEEHDEAAVEVATKPAAAPPSSACRTNNAKCQPRPLVVLGNLFDGLILEGDTLSHTADAATLTKATRYLPPVVVVERGGKLDVRLKMNPKDWRSIQLPDRLATHVQDVLHRNLVREQSFVVRKSSVAVGRRKPEGKSPSSKRGKRTNSTASASTSQSSRHKSREFVESSEDSDADLRTAAASAASRLVKQHVDTVGSGSKRRFGSSGVEDVRQRGERVDSTDRSNAGPKNKLFDDSSDDDSDTNARRVAALAWQPVLADLSDGSSKNSTSASKSVKKKEGSNPGRRSCHHDAHVDAIIEGVATGAILPSEENGSVRRPVVESSSSSDEETEPVKKRLNRHRHKGEVEVTTGVGGGSGSPRREEVDSFDALSENVNRQPEVETPVSVAVDEPTGLDHGDGSGETSRTPQPEDAPPDSAATDESNARVKESSIKETVPVKDLVAISAEKANHKSISKSHEKRSGSLDSGVKDGGHSRETSKKDKPNNIVDLVKRKIATDGDSSKPNENHKLAKKDGKRTESSHSKSKEQNDKHHRKHDRSTSHEKKHRLSDKEDDTPSKKDHHSSKENHRDRHHHHHRSSKSSRADDEPPRKKKKSSHHHHHHHGDRSPPPRPSAKEEMVVVNVKQQLEPDHSGAKALWKNIQIRISRSDAEATARFRKEEKARRRAARKMAGREEGDDDTDDANDKLGMTCLAVVSRLKPSVIEKWCKRSKSTSSTTFPSKRSKLSDSKNSRDSRRPSKGYSRLRVVSDDSSSERSRSPPPRQESKAKRPDPKGQHDKKHHPKTGGDGGRKDTVQKAPTKKKGGDENGTSKSKVATSSSVAPNSKNKDQRQAKKNVIVVDDKLKWPTAATSKPGADFNVDSGKLASPAKRAGDRSSSSELPALPLPGFEDGSLLNEEDGVFGLINDEEVLLQARKVGPVVECVGEDRADGVGVLPNSEEILFDPLGESAGWEDLKDGEGGDLVEEDQISGTSGVSGDLFDIEDAQMNPFRSGFSLDGVGSTDARVGEDLSTLEDLREYGDFLKDCDFHGGDRDMAASMEITTPTKQSPHVVGGGSLDGSVGRRSHSPRSAVAVPFAQINDTNLTSNGDDGDWDERAELADGEGSWSHRDRGRRSLRGSHRDFDLNNRHGQRSRSPLRDRRQSRSPLRLLRGNDLTDKSRVSRTVLLAMTPPPEEMEPDVDVLGDRVCVTNNRRRFCALERTSQRACKSVFEDTLSIFASSYKDDLVQPEVASSTETALPGMGGETDVYDGGSGLPDFLLKLPPPPPPPPPKEISALDVLGDSLADDIVLVKPSSLEDISDDELPVFQVLANQSFMAGGALSSVDLTSVFSSGVSETDSRTKDKVEMELPNVKNTVDADDYEIDDPVALLAAVPELDNLPLATLMRRFERELRHRNLQMCVAIYYRLSTMIASEIQFDLLDSLVNLAKDKRRVDQVIGNFLLQTVVENIPYSDNIPKQASLMIRALSIAKKCDENPLFNHRNPKRPALEAWSLNAVYNCVLLEALNRSMAEVVHLFRGGLEIGLLLSGELVRGLVHAFCDQDLQAWAKEAYRIGLSTGIYPTVKVRDWPTILNMRSYYSESEMSTILADFLPKYTAYMRGVEFGGYHLRREQQYTIYVNIEVVEDSEATRVSSLGNIDWSLSGATTRMAAACGKCQLDFFARADMNIRKIGHHSVIRYIDKSRNGVGELSYPKFEEHDFSQLPSKHIFGINVFRRRTGLPLPPR